MSGFALAPLPAMLVIVVALAAFPIAWAYWRYKAEGQRSYLAVLTVLTLFLCFDLVLFGAFTRLTDSGLGCPDWPGCYAQSNPLAAKAHIDAAQAAQPSGAVTWNKAWIEMVHRYLAAIVGFLIVVMTVLAWRKKAMLEGSPWWPTATLVWVLLQGLFGALTVTMKLYPAIVTGHLLGGMGLLALLAAQLRSVPAQRQVLTNKMRGFVILVAMLSLLQITLGAWVSTNYAVLAC